MSKDEQVRIWGEQRPEIDVDLMAQIVMMLGHQLANEAMTDGEDANGEDVATSDDQTDTQPESSADGDPS